MSQVAIVIPVYKETCQVWERFALERCAHILNRYQIIFVGPKNLKYDYYVNIIKNAQVIKFDDIFFTSVASYSKLLLSINFYESFLNYQYILIHQLDAFVFEDHLSDWCEKNYDYIGAPWFQDFGHNMAAGFMGTGNGGFSLRNVKKSLAVLNSTRLESLSVLNIKNLLSFCYKNLFRARGTSPVFQRIQEYINKGAGEDMFWGLEAKKFYPSFNIPPVEEAVYFSFETGLQYLHTKYESRTPFGCHAEWNTKILYSLLHLKQSPSSEYDHHLYRIFTHATQSKKSQSF